MTRNKKTKGRPRLNNSDGSAAKPRRPRSQGEPPSVDRVLRSRASIAERDELLFDSDGSDPLDNPNVGRALRGRHLQE